MQLSKKTWIVTAIVAVVVVGMALFDWNWLRGPLSTYISTKLGRAVAIEGNLRGEFSFHPLFTADGVVISNVPGSKDSEMARAQRVAVRIDLWSLLRRPVSLPEVTLIAPRVLLERYADGNENWRFGTPGAADAPSGAPIVGRLTIDDGLLHFRDVSAATDVTVKVASSASADGSLPVSFQGSGTLRGNSFTIDGSAATLLALGNEDRPYRLDVQAKAGNTSARFNGRLIPARPDNVDGSLSLQGRDLSQLYPIIPVPLPWTPAYSLSGQLRHTGAVWSFEKFTGKIGASDMAGTLSVDRKNQRSLIEADLVSQQLNYKDLGGLVGLPPVNEAPQARTAQQNNEAARQDRTGRVLPTKPYDLERLRVADARVHLRGKRFMASNLPLDDLDAVLDLQDGLLKLQPLDFGVAGGKVVSTLAMDARDRTIRTKGDITVRNLELSRILPTIKPPNGSAGKLGGRAHFAATGNSVADMLASTDGEVALISTGGQSSELAVVLSNLDLANAVQLLLKGDASSPIQCVVADFAGENGVMRAKTLVVDTAAEKILGSGTVDFRNERYDLTLKAQSKKASLVALRGPIIVTGSFKSPHVGPAAGPLAIRVGATVALGVALTPIAALLPLIDLGGAPDADCRALMAEAHDNVQTRASAPTASMTR